MNINEIYPQLKLNFDIRGITCHSKKVRQQFIFVAIKGKHFNGQKFIKEALENGAYLIITDQMVLGN